jgi:hypothetical protein
VNHIKGELKPNHLAAIRFRIEGKDNDFIAKELGVKKRTLYYWWSDPKIKEELDRQMSQVTSLFVEKMATLGLASLTALEDMVREDHTGPISPETRLEIIQAVLDRIPVTSKSKDLQEAPGSSVNVNVFSEMSDGQLLQQAKMLARNVVDGEAEPIDG